MVFKKDLCDCLCRVTNALEYVSPKVLAAIPTLRGVMRQGNDGRWNLASTSICRGSLQPGLVQHSSWYIPAFHCAGTAARAMRSEGR
jgi:hypothetical protein